MKSLTETTKKQETACEEMLRAIMRKMENDRGRESWGRVGDLAALERDLREICEREGISDGTKN